MKSPWFRRLLTFVAMSVRRICGAANKLGELGSAGFFEHQPHQAGLLCFGLLVLLARAATGAPSDPAASFTPDLSGPQLQPRGEEAGEFSISEQTGSPSYRYSLTVPPGRRGIEPRVALVYSVVRAMSLRAGPSMSRGSIGSPGKANSTFSIRGLQRTLANFEIGWSAQTMTFIPS